MRESRSAGFAPTDFDLWNNLKCATHLKHGSLVQRRRRVCGCIHGICDNTRAHKLGVFFGMCLFGCVCSSSSRFGAGFSAHVISREHTRSASDFRSSETETLDVLVWTCGRRPVGCCVCLFIAPATQPGPNADNSVQPVAASRLIKYYKMTSGNMLKRLGSAIHEMSSRTRHFVLWSDTFTLPKNKNKKIRTKWFPVAERIRFEGSLFFLQKYIFSGTTMCELLYTCFFKLSC